MPQRRLTRASRAAASAALPGLTVLLGLVGIVGLVAGGIAAAAPAGAAAAFQPFSGAPVVGDLTGDGVADQTVFGRFGPSNDLTTPCGVRITPGGGSSPVTLKLPVQTSAGASQHTCPDLGTVMVTRAGNRLATATFIGEWNAAPDIQIFTLTGSRMVYRAGLDGQSQPSVIGSQDFDGDGYGDLWESTDQGSGFSSWYVRGTSVRELFSAYSGFSPTVTFADLNRSRGTDILVGTGAGGGSMPPAAWAVDGLTGARQNLASTPPADNYTETVVDIDHDGRPDLRVDGDQFGGPDVTQYYLNRCKGSTWSFVPTTQTPVAGS